jgi:hypothetical protein
MSAEQMQKIFDDFYTTKERGTGLGLSIVRRLLSDLGGSVHVESEPGKGARFTVELPCAEADSARVVDSAGDAERTRDETHDAGVARRAGTAPHAAPRPSAAARSDGTAR